MKTLFQPPLSRDTDVITSDEAAEKMIKSGALNKQEALVYQAITNYINYHKLFDSVIHSDSYTFTTKEIARQMQNLSNPYHKCYDICRKRFSGLHNKGKIDRLNTKGGIYQENKGQKLMKRDGCAVWRLI